ncbi:uncharacterized protein L199_004638 [Kwoniella botswanensis]|uniref:uncharacterized protein n=1 Tax=Kwoniella botswanensis TaxID=1268659 RepID=UPI00315DC158
MSSNDQQLSAANDPYGYSSAHGTGRTSQQAIQNNASDHTELWRTYQQDLTNATSDAERESIEARYLSASAELQSSFWTHNDPGDPKRY